jgi:uncharacterized phiE125 gp8 family phage protein
MGLSVTIPATDTPVSVADVRDHLRIDHTDEDELLASYVRAATSWAEGVLGLSLMPRTLRQTRPCFGDRMELASGPVSAVSSIGYRDLDGADQVLDPSGYLAILDEVVPYVCLAPGQSWPGTQVHPQAVTITYVAGHASAGAISQDIRQAILLVVGQFYEFREPIVAGAGLAKVPMAAEALLQPHRVIGGTS